MNLWKFAPVFKEEKTMEDVGNEYIITIIVRTEFGNICTMYYSYISYK